ncbi:tRNA (adenosine(37)-N6)-threonylcarbamoyltransferase complex ATPase subunit type 1 TsaE [Candidatus Saccharibacteria bacterium]|nr:tRNA (adenosine(37)-N6)-threonylcarbamoyltransferase complex ATPase subunit type 1 TsaE [Candidatus Saccharibacteria bacterium]
MVALAPWWSYHWLILVMSFAMTLSISTSEPASTLAAAAKLASHLQGGEVIELRSDLGGGKTTFVKGLAAALGYTGSVTSPTFTLSQIYQLPGGRELHHYDLYRLTEAGVVGSELSEDIGQPDIITVIEWAGIAETALPADRVVIDLIVTGENDRELNFSATGPQAAQLIEDIKQ